MSFFSPFGKTVNEVDLDNPIKSVIKNDTKSKSGTNQSSNTPKGNTNTPKGNTGTGTSKNNNAQLLKLLKNAQAQLSSLSSQAETLSGMQANIDTLRSDAKSASEKAEQARIDALKSQAEAQRALADALAAQKAAQSAFNALPKPNPVVQVPAATSAVSSNPSFNPSGFSSGTSVSTISSGASPVTSSPSTPSEVSATPAVASSATKSTPPPIVKTAPIDTVLTSEDDLPIEIMTDLIFENIGGQELINIARNDTVNGQKVIYQPIKNLFNIQQEYNSNNIVNISGTANKYFQNFPINFDSKVPYKEEDEPHVYINPQNGELIIEAINLEVDEQIEMQIVIGGTIYEAEL